MHENDLYKNLEVLEKKIEENSIKKMGIMKELKEESIMYYKVSKNFRNIAVKISLM
jgi:hypothetical protein